MTRAIFFLTTVVAIGLILLAPAVVVFQPTQPAAAPSEAAPDLARSAVDDLAAWPATTRP